MIVIGKAILAILNLFGGGTAILETARDIINKGRDVDLEKFKTATGAEKEVALKGFDAQIAANGERAQLYKAGAVGLMWGAAALILFALPTGIHYWALALDSMPLFGHAVGSWGIAKLPGQYHDISREIILSFFITGGAVSGVGAVAYAVARARR